MLTSYAPSAASATSSKTPPEATPPAVAARQSGLHLPYRSLTQRLIVVAVAWIVPLLLLGGFALDKVISSALTANFDARLSQFVVSFIAASELGPFGEVRLTRPLGDQRFFEPFSGLYYQVTTQGQLPYRSRSLWDRQLPPDTMEPHFRDHVYEVEAWPGERLRVIERDAILPNSSQLYHFMVAERVASLKSAQARFRQSLFWALGGLGLGLIALSSLQVTYGLRPLDRVQRRLELIRKGAAQRLEQDYPNEVQPLADEMNALLGQAEQAAERARTHAGNLAHALKTPIAVLLNEAEGQHTPFGSIVIAQMATMQRHVEHHLARARAMGRQASLSARTPLNVSLNGLKRALERIYRDGRVRIGIMGETVLSVRADRQDVDEILGNILDNACKYGAGEVSVTITRENRNGKDFVRICVADNGRGIPAEARERLFSRGVRLDESVSGTGLGLAIVRDLVEIYGGSVDLGESRELGGLEVRIYMPLAATPSIAA